MFTLRDLKQSINDFINYNSTNINYLRNLITSLNNANMMNIDSLLFELQVNNIVLNGYSNIISKTFYISSVELPIFFQKPNQEMAMFLSNMNSVMSRFMNTLVNVTMINTFVGTNENKGYTVTSVELSSGHSDNIEEVIRELNKLNTVLSTYLRKL